MFESMWNSHVGRHGHHHHHQHGGPPWAWGRRGFGRGFHGRDVGEREDVRWPVLDALGTQPRSGFEITQAIELQTAGGFRPSPAVVYPTLQLLEELGHVRVIEQDGRKQFAITEAGQQDLEAHREDVRAFYDRFDDDARERQFEELAELVQRAARVFKTFRRASRHGQLPPEMQRRVREVIGDAVKRVEAILAEAPR
jgi:DNA-binding PadR family transcriptional regulator